MPDISPAEIIRDGQRVPNRHILLGERDAVDIEIPDGPLIVPLALWQARQAELRGRADLGVWLDSDQPPAAIAADLEAFTVIAINFPVFTDGRGFSYARALRKRHHYKGELRAIGPFIRDQLFYMHRCGFNAYALATDDLDSALQSLEVFSDAYQASYDRAEPLFRRRG
ncbi:MAG TPA: DUF934 domain-containing protein [Spongiibacteraceae bacterium]|jgi:uncharacterized protein (DUF934 family)|nr:DUF934 domain-containing protein [Spongiibacteraceae bacterium]HUH37156.1 DUF934 domain-containing protein [Spongiibacteraceae bacterium]